MAGTQKQLRAGKQFIKNNFNHFNSLCSYVRVSKTIQATPKTALPRRVDAPFIIFIVLLNFLAQLQ